MFLVGQGSGYKNAEDLQNDKAKILARAATTFRYAGDADDVWITRRPKSLFARNKMVGGGMANLALEIGRAHV